MRFIFPIFLFATLIFGNQIITNHKTGEEISLYNKSWAVIIGIDDYENEKPLSYCVADANSIQSILINNFDFNPDHITTLTNQEASLQGIRNAFNRIIKEAGKDDRVLIYFAGHGFTEDLPDGGEIGYLAPVDAERENAYLTCLPMEELKTVSQRSTARQVMFLVDACHGGLAAINKRSLDSSSKNYLKKISGMKARQLISAGGRDEEVIEKPEWGHSAFTYKLIHGLKDGLADRDEDYIITASELHTFLKRSVSTLTGFSQTPRFNYLSDDEGEFVFTIKKDDETDITPTMRVVENMTSSDKFGTLIINSIPKLARVSLDNKYIGDTPFEETVPQGQYLFKVEKENYESEIAIISVKEDIETNKEILLSYSQLYIDKSISEYHRKLKQQKAARYISALGIVISALRSYQYHQTAQLNYDKYNTAVEVDKMDQYYNQYESSLQSAHISIGISIPFILTYGWTYLKPIKPPEFD